ncbi:MAG: hypothetical protein ACI9UA_000672 [Pseudoalteromonas tetraodonis]|jgi:hypothetical protein
MMRLRLNRKSTAGSLIPHFVAVALAWVVLILPGLAAEPFVEGVDSVAFVDSAVDRQGNVYYVGNQVGEVVLTKIAADGRTLLRSSTAFPGIHEASAVAYGRIISGGNLEDRLFVLGTATRGLRTGWKVRAYTLDGTDPPGGVEEGDIGFWGKDIAFTSGRRSDGSLNPVVYVCGEGPTRMQVTGLPADDLGGTSIEFGGFGFAGTNYADMANALTIDDAGNVYVAGRFSEGTVTEGELGAWRRVTNSIIADRSYIDVAELATGAKSPGKVLLAYDTFLGFPNPFDPIYGYWYNPIRDSVTSVKTPDTSVPPHLGVLPQLAMRVTGSFDIEEAGDYDFRVEVDNGVRFKVNGAVVTEGARVADYDGLNAEEFKNQTFAAGSHTFDFLMYDSGGPEDAKLEIKKTSEAATEYKVLKSPQSGTPNPGSPYILKFSANLNPLKVYSPDDLKGVYTDVTFADGWVYSTGVVQGDRTVKISTVDRTPDAECEVVRIDPEFEAPTSAWVFHSSEPADRPSLASILSGSSSDLIAGLGIAADDDGNAYVSGRFDSGASRFLSAGRAGGSPSEFLEVSASLDSRFVARLDSAMAFADVWIPKQVPVFGGGFSSSQVNDLHTLLWHPGLGRLFAGMDVASGEIRFGEGDEEKSIAGPAGVIAVFEPDMTVSRRVNLSVGSAFGDSGIHVRPFSGTPDTPQSAMFLEGVELTVATDPVVYQEETGGEFVSIRNPTQESIRNDAVVRRRSIGYIIDDTATTTGKQSYTFVIDRDTKIEFLWETDFALEIVSDLGDTLGADGSRLESIANGNPDPPVQKHWYLENDEVAPQIDAAVGGFTTNGGRIRFVVGGFDATGAASDNGQNSEVHSYLNVDETEADRKLNPFPMSGPAVVTWSWRKQIGVQMITTGPNSAALPLVHVKTAADPALAFPQPLVQTVADRGGSETLYFDEHAEIYVLSRYQNSLGDLTLGGWLTSVGNAFDSGGGDLDDLDQYLLDGVDYRGRFISDLVEPISVTWDYGEPIFYEDVSIGSGVQLDTVDNFFVRNSIKRDVQPIVELIDGPFGSSIEDMYEWDAFSGTLFPVRPGTIRTQWERTGSTSKVTVDVTIKFPSGSGVVYPHIALTPPVPIDPAEDDYEFVKTAYTTGDGVVNQDDESFSATLRGKTVIVYQYFSESGGAPEPGALRVRVIDTKLWDDDSEDSRALVGERVTSTFDEAGLETGYMFYERSRYNVNLHDRDSFTGPIFPVNQTFSGEEEDDFVVVWYTTRDLINWPHQAVFYDVRWPDAVTAPRIVIASEFGSESAPSGTDPEAQQLVAPAVPSADPPFPDDAFTYDPSRFVGIRVYNQPDANLAGYNPNEEHALIAPSQRFATVAPRPVAVYALRNNDLNVLSTDENYTSDPFVLVEYFDLATEEWDMALYKIELEDPDLGYTFEKEMIAGEPVIPFYPLGVVNGASPCEESFAIDGRSDPSDPNFASVDQQQVYWEDHRGNSYAISGGFYQSDGAPVFFDAYFSYRMLTDFAWPLQSDPGVTLGARQASDCVAFLTRPVGATYLTKPYSTVVGDYENPQPVRYTVNWPDEVPILKVGETLTYGGGEYRSDNPFTEVPDGEGGVRTVATPGVPGVVGWAAGKIVFDTLNPAADPVIGRDRYTARLYPPLSARSVPLDVSSFPISLLPANGRTRVAKGRYVFNELPASLQRRVTYDPLDGRLTMIGILNDKKIGDATLTASPGAVFALEPNILTELELDQLLALAPGDSTWRAAAESLYKLTRNPNLVDTGQNFADADALIQYWKNYVQSAQGAQQPIALADADGGYLVGVAPQTLVVNQQVAKVTDPFGIDVVVKDPSVAAPQSALGPGLAVSTNPAFLNPNDVTLPDVSYITLVENDDPALAGNPVTVHVVKVDRRERYRGAIKVIYSDNVFDEAVTLRHTGDFGAFADDLVFEWWYRPADGTEFPPPDRSGSPNPWKIFPDASGKRGLGFFNVTVQGTPNAPEALLADSLWFARYRHKNEVAGDVVTWDNLFDRVGESLWQWAGAGNSTPQDQDGDGFPDYRPQLMFGWVKRVLDAVNLFEARVRDFSGDAPATYVDIIRQLGQQFEAPVALNPDKDVIENVGLIELYGTVLDRARGLSIDLSTPVSTDGITIALQLAATRLSDFYQLLGDEAYTDALDPTIGHGSSSAAYGHLAPAVFAFQNQTASLLTEELALLRGVDDNFARPVYNRLMWNFTKGEGEAAYATNYDIFDATRDGFVNEDDSMVLFPQGHGDAWGHYLTAVRGQYDLLRHRAFNWVSRSEQYALNDIVFDVDFLDERKFAEAAAKKAKTGAQIVALTYRDAYVADPTAQWQGYIDPVDDGDRAWGVEGWSRRAGQGAYFDWITANALLPAEHPNEELEGIRKIDRTTNEDIPVISANLTYIQSVFDQANDGFNPLGLAPDAVPFDINPAALDRFFAGGNSHFDQVFNRATSALANAKATFDHANKADNLLRKVGSSAEDFARSVSSQDRSYRNQLIDFFGLAYPGTVGAGQAYPEGYSGPDTQLFMYAETREVNNDTVPGQIADFRGKNFDPNNLRPSETGDFGTDVSFITEGGGILENVPSAWRERYSASFAGASLSDLLGNVNGNFDTNYTDLDPANRRVDLQNLNLPVTAIGYTFQAPPAWGKRPHYGKLQIHIQKMVQKEADLANAIASYDGYIGELIRQLRLLDARIDLNGYTRALNITDTTLGQIAATSQLAFELASENLEFSGDNINNLADVSQSAFPNTTPTGGVAVSPGDIFSGFRSAFKLGGSVGSLSLQVSSLATGQVAKVIEFADQLRSAIIEIVLEERERDFATQQSLVELENAIGDEGILRVRIFKELQALQQLSDEYRSLMAQAQRLMDERESFNKKVASLVQRNRYQDMTFRVSRNAALQKYHESFELAARYAYLAAKAYDYESNLHPNDPASAQPLYEDIVKARTIGLVNGQTPQTGSGGLSEVLAQMKGNFEVLRGQLGFNNPQAETGRFSLRTEFFRLKSRENRAFSALTPEEISEAENNDQLWRNELTARDPARPDRGLVDDLWDVYEFRRFCRPFAPEKNASGEHVPQPGLVISFPTRILSGQNFFGKPLAAGDSFYDPTNFATKVRSVGVWLENYDKTLLPTTPRVYLVPVGRDIMTIPTSAAADPETGGFQVRYWDVLDQAIPVPFPSVDSFLDRPGYRPSTDSLLEPEGSMRRFSSFLAHGYTNSNGIDESSMTWDSRLVGRSVWNEEWLLIIPGASLGADTTEALKTFVEGPLLDGGVRDPRSAISDIKIFLRTYGYSGG